MRRRAPTRPSANALRILQRPRGAGARVPGEVKDMDTCGSNMITKHPSGDFATLRITFCFLEHRISMDIKADDDRLVHETPFHWSSEM